MNTQAPVVDASSPGVEAPQHRVDPHPVAALAFLYWHAFLNRLKSQAKRIRSPRYVIAVVLGVAYIYWALIGYSRDRDNPFAAIIGSDIFVSIAAVLLLLAAARWWLFGSERGALAFTPAEVQFLFPGPVTRRGLIHAKLVRSQIAILINTLIWMVLLRGDAASVMGWRRGLALWLLFSTLSLHRLGATIVRVNALENARAGWRRSALPAAVFVALVGTVAFALLSELRALRMASIGGVRQLLAAVTDVLQATGPTIALAPVRALLDPVFARDAATWAAHLPWALLVFLLHYLWVVRMDRSFEEAALEATQHRAARLQRFRTSQLSDVRSRKGKLARIPALGLRGRPEVAIAWKNIAAAIRGGAWRTQVISFTIGVAVMGVIARSASARAGDVFLGIVAGWGAMLLFVGPLWMRFDLRLDLQNLAVLKTFPVSGARMVLAEIAGVTLLHSITIWALMAVPIVMILQDPELMVQSRADIPLMLAIAVAIPALNAIMFTVQNAIALLYPAWVRLGTEARGFETMGQNLLTTGATALVAAVGLVFPVGIGVLIAWASHGFLGSLGVLIGTMAGVSVVAVELWPVILWLGRVFERTDLTDIPAQA